MSDGLDLVRRIELVEAEAWQDAWAAAGLETRWIGGALLLVGPASFVLGLGVLEHAVEGVLDEIVATYRALGVGSFEVRLASTAQPLELRDWLAAKGFAIVGQTTVRHRLVGGAEGRARGRRVRDAAAWGRAFARRCGLPPELGPALGAVVGRPGWSAYVGGGALFVHEGAGWVVGPAAGASADAAAMGCDLVAAGVPADGFVETYERTRYLYT